MTSLQRKLIEVSRCGNLDTRYVNRCMGAECGRGRGIRDTIHWSKRRWISSARAAVSCTCVIIVSCYRIVWRAWPISILML